MFASYGTWTLLEGKRVCYKPQILSMRPQSLGDCYKLFIVIQSKMLKKLKVVILSWWWILLNYFKESILDIVERCNIAIAMKISKSISKMFKSK